MQSQTYKLEPAFFENSAPFCYAPKYKDNEYDEADYCKADTNTWKNLRSKQIVETGEDFTWYYREASGECGPQCRPSCITLMLDLNTLDYESEITCTPNELCHCAHVPRSGSECTESRLEALFDNHPKCYLEDADCLGPTLYDNKVKRAIDLQPSIAEFADLRQCDTLPDDGLYCRFQDWKIINPIEKYSCRDGSFPECLERDSKIYWEYCNIVEEDAGCDYDEECTENGRCGKNCPKITEPFPAGWTTFVVSAAIPFRPTLNSLCAEQLPLSDATSSACFLQRIELFYPPEDADCGIGCPHCHDCPLLSLGDKFGPLEVVGFGHGIAGRTEGHSCAACDSRDSLSCGKGVELDCDDLFKWKCEESTNCYTNELLGVNNFAENQCTFGIPEEASSTRGFSFATAGGHDAGKDAGFKSAVSVPTVLLAMACMLLFLLFQRRRLRNRVAKGAYPSGALHTLEPISEDDESNASEGAKRGHEDMATDENVETVHISNVNAFRQKLHLLDCTRPTNRR